MELKQYVIVNGVLIEILPGQSLSDVYDSD